MDSGNTSHPDWVSNHSASTGSCSLLEVLKDRSGILLNLMPYKVITLYWVYYYTPPPHLNFTTQSFTSVGTFWGSDLNFLTYSQGVHPHHGIGVVGGKLITRNVSSLFSSCFKIQYKKHKIDDALETFWRCFNPKWASKVFEFQRKRTASKAMVSKLWK